MPISELYISSRRMRVEVTSRRMPAPPQPTGHSDMEVTSRVQPLNHSAASPLSKSCVASSSWTSGTGGPGGTDCGFLDCLDSPLAAKLRLTASHCRLPSTDSGIQADAGWDSLKRGAHSSTSEGAAGGRTPQTGLVESFGVGDRRLGEGSFGSGDLRASATSGVSYRETTHRVPSVVLDSNRSAVAVNSASVLMKPSGPSLPSHVPTLVLQTGAIQERNPAPLNLLSASTPVIPSSSAPGRGAGPLAGQWVMGGRNLFPPQARPYLEQTQAGMPQAASSGSVFRLNEDSRVEPTPISETVTPSQQQSGPHVTLYPVQVQHLEAPASVPTYTRPRVNAVTTRHLGPSLHPVHKLHVEVVSTPGTGACVAREGSVLHESSLNSSYAPVNSLAGGIPRSRASPAQARRSLRGRSPKLSSSTTGVVHNIPIKHLDTCSACLKTPSAVEPIKTGIANGTAPDNRSVPCSAAVGDTFQEVGFVRGLGSPGGAREADLDAVLFKLVQQAAGEGEGLDGVHKARKGSAVDSPQDIPWRERRSRIDSALLWLRNELEALRAMDAALVTQFRRCQDTIETLKQQRDAAWDGEGSEWGSAYGGGPDGSEMDEDEAVWEDWEIAEFERKWAEDPSASEVDETSPSCSSATSSTLSFVTEINCPKITAPDDKVAASSDNTTVSSDNISSSPHLEAAEHPLDHATNPSRSLSAVKQDVEVTV